MGEPSSALRLGFADIKEKGHSGGDPAATPSKIGVRASPFTFRCVHDETDTQLSGDAQRLMEELREQAAKIKADMVAQRETERANGEAGDRKIARPKGKSGRFSAAHMAEFKKMDSIEGHASAWRAQAGRVQPVSSLKRSPSKANLESTPPASPFKSGIKRSPSKADLDVSTPLTPKISQSLKRKSSRANLDEFQQSPSPKKSAIPSARKPLVFPNVNVEQRVPSKRFKQRMEDDASTARPVSRDGTSIPRPKSSSSSTAALPPSTSRLARLLSPTKASLAHSAPQRKPGVSLVKSPSKTDLGGSFLKSASKPGLGGGLVKSLSKPDLNKEDPTESLSTQNLGSSIKSTTPRSRVVSPGRFERVKSILRGHRTASGNVQTAIPQPLTSQTPGPPKADKDKVLPPLPLTTPRRKVTKHVAFTPEVGRIASEQNSPSPAKTMPKSFAKSLKDAGFQGIDALLSKKSGDISYPDLSGFRPLPEIPTQQEEIKPSQIPGTFTFRSDHTIEFGDAPSSGFGASPGQSSVRRVRQSLKPGAEMPGAFPAPNSPGSHPNKENKLPGPSKVLFGAPHGMSNKKRHRASWDEEEAEEKDAERAAKKRKNEHVPEGDALLAPRLVGSTPSAKKIKAGSAISRTAGSASPTKKRAGLSLSRLNMLARPKNRA